MIAAIDARDIALAEDLARAMTQENQNDLESLVDKENAKAILGHRTARQEPVIAQSCP